MMATNNKDQTIWWSTGDEHFPQYTTPPETAGVNPYICANTNDVYTKSTASNAIAPQEISKEDVDQAIGNLIQEQSNLAEAIVRYTGKKLPEANAVSKYNKDPFGGLDISNSQTFLDPCLRDWSVWNKYFTAQVELESCQLSNSLDFDQLKDLLYRAGAPNKFILLFDFEHIIKAQNWYHGDPNEILFWHEGYDSKIFAESCRKSSYKSPIKVPFVAIGTRLVKRERFLNMAFHLKEARRNVYRDFNNIVRGTNLSEEFHEAVTDLFMKQQCAHNIVFKRKIHYDVGYTFDYEHGDKLQEGIKDIDSFMIDTILNHFRHREARKFQDKGSIMRYLVRENRGHQAAKAIFVNHDLGESVKISWARLMNSNTSEDRPSVQEITDGSEIEAAPQVKATPQVEVAQAEASVAHNKKDKPSAKKKNKSKSKQAEVKNQTFKVLQNDSNAEKANTSNPTATNSEIIGTGVKILTAVGDASGELSLSASITTMQTPMDSGATILDAQPTAENIPIGQDLNLFVPLMRVSANLGDSTMDNITSRPHGRSNSTRAKSMTDVEINEAAIRNESLDAVRKRLKDDATVPTRDSNERAKANARAVRANSINMIRKRTMSRTTNRPNLAELGAISGMLDTKESTAVDDYGEAIESSQDDEVSETQGFEVKESTGSQEAAGAEIYHTLNIEDVDDSASEMINGNKDTPLVSESENDQLPDTSEQNLQSKQRHVAPLPETQEIFQIKPSATPKNKKGKSKKKSKTKGKKGQKSLEKVATTGERIPQDEGPVHQSSETSKKESSTSQPQKVVLSELEDLITEVESHQFPVERGDPTIEAEAELFREEKYVPTKPETERLKLEKDIFFVNSIDAPKATEDVTQQTYASEVIGVIQHISKTIEPTEGPVKSMNALEEATGVLDSTQEAREHGQLAQKKLNIPNKTSTGTNNLGDSSGFEGLASVIAASSALLPIEGTDRVDYAALTQNSVSRLIDQMPEDYTEARDSHLSKARAVSAEVDSSIPVAARDSVQRSKSINVVMPLVSVKKEHQTKENGTKDTLEILADISGAHPLANCFLYGQRYECAYCSAQTFESLSEVSPAIICPGCGPCSYIRYCSHSCALLDSYKHSRICSRTSENYPIVWGTLPLRYHQLIPALVPYNGYHSAELFRQMAYSWYCHEDDGSPIHLLRKWGEINWLEDQASYEEFFGPSGPPAQVHGDYFLFNCLPSDPDETRAFVTILFYNSDEFNRTLNCCFLDNNQHKLLEFLYRMIWNELNAPDGTIAHNPENALRIAHEFQHQFWLEFRFSPSHCSNRGHFDFEREWSSVEDIIDTMERRHPMLRAWRRDGPPSQIPTNPWDRFFGKSWPPATNTHTGRIKKFFVPKDAIQFFHQGWTGHYPLPPSLLENRLLEGY